MSTVAKDERDTALRQLLEIYCTFLPQQRAHVEELVAAKVPLHTVTSLYPLDWRLLHARLRLPDIDRPFNIVLDLAKIYNTAEDDLWEVEGGAYWAEGKSFFEELKSSSYIECTSRILRQLPAYERGSFETGYIDTCIAAMHWYTWSFENWEKLDDGNAKDPLLRALSESVECLYAALDDDFCNLSQEGAR